MKIITMLLFFVILYGHDVENDFIKWKRYCRIGAITENNEFGVGTYFRINRRTKYTFKDLIFNPTFSFLSNDRIVKWYNLLSLINLLLSL